MSNWIELSACATVASETVDLVKALARQWRQISQRWIFAFLLFTYDACASPPELSPQPPSHP